MTCLADVCSLHKWQICQVHKTHDHPYECEQCACVLEAVNSMLDMNKNQIMRFKAYSKLLTPVTNEKQRAQMREIYDQPVPDEPIPAKWIELRP